MIEKLRTEKSKTRRHYIVDFMSVMSPLSQCLLVVNELTVTVLQTAKQG